MKLRFRRARSRNSFRPEPEELREGRRLGVRCFVPVLDLKAGKLHLRVARLRSVTMSRFLLAAGFLFTHGGCVSQDASQGEARAGRATFEAVIGSAWWL